MMPRALPLAACLTLCGYAAGAEGTAEAGAGGMSAGGAGANLSYVAITVPLEGHDYLAVIDLPAAVPVMVNGSAADLSAPAPVAVRIGRADGGSMADAAYRAREVLAEACPTQGLQADAAVAPVLTAAGHWIFAEGCK